MGPNQRQRLAFPHRGAAGDRDGDSDPDRGVLRLSPRCHGCLQIEQEKRRNHQRRRNKNQRDDLL